MKIFDEQIKNHLVEDTFAFVVIGSHKRNKFLNFFIRVFLIVNLTMEIFVVG